MVLISGVAWWHCRHLLREIISPRILDDLERWTVDRASDIDPYDFHDFLVDIRASQKVVKSGRIVRYRAMVVVGDLKVGFKKMEFSALGIE